jgi:hypothetical protein
MNLHRYLCKIINDLKTYFVVMRFYSKKLLQKNANVSTFQIIKFKFFFENVDPLWATQSVKNGHKIFIDRLIIN